MHHCPHCRFLSDPTSGSIYDDRFPCPKCKAIHPKFRKQRLRTPIKNPKTIIKKNWKKGFSGFKGLGEFGDLSGFSKLNAIIKISLYGGAFFFANKKLRDIESGETREDQRFRDSLGPLVASLKKASYFIPAFAVPHAVELVTNDSWALLGTIYSLAIAFVMVKTAGQPVIDRVAG